MKSLLKYSFIFICIYFNSTCFVNSQAKWSTKLDALKVFIENKGQFAESSEKYADAKYIYFGSCETYYFTDKGVVIEMNLYKKQQKFSTWASKLFRNEKEEREDFETEKIRVKAEWLNTNSALEVESEGCSAGYYTGKNGSAISNGFSKIIYKNIYPNIDIVYTIPKDRSGIKYEILLKPGADLTMIKLKYSGDINEVLKRNNNIEIYTDFKVITEHAPITYICDSKQQIGSSFDLKNNIITYNTESYSADKSVVIDPWVSTTLTNTADIGYMVDYDDQNNLYVYSRTDTGTIYVSKYSDVGVHLWTHIVTSNVLYEGAFIVEKTTQRIYISEGFNASGSYVYRLNNNGIPDGWQTPSFTNFVEIWDMVFDPLTNELIVLGGGTLSNLNGGRVNMITGNYTSTNFTGFGGICQDIVSGAIDNNRQLYTLFARTICGTPGQIDNKIIKVNNTLTGPDWIAPTGFNSFLESANHVPPAGAQTSNGFNALAVNNDFLYLYSGGELAAYNKSSGSMISSLYINLLGNFYTNLNQGGIDVDDCNNVFLGGDDGNIVVYNFNGSTFNLQNILSLNWSGANSRVEDVKYNKANHKLFASGKGNIGILEMPYECNINTCINTIILDVIGCTDNDMINISGEISVSTIPTSGTLIVSDIESGVSQMIYPPFTNPIQFSLNNIPVTTTSSGITATFSGEFSCSTIANYTPLVPPTLSTNIIHPSCGQNNGSAIVSVNSGLPNYTYEWSTGYVVNNTSNTSSLITNILSGVYNVTVTDGNDCHSYETINVSDSIFNANIVLNYQPICYGQCNGSIIGTVIGNGQIPPYSFNWSNGILHNSSISSDTITGLCSGQYTLTVTDSLGCSSVASYTLTERPELGVQIMSANNPSCIGGSDGIISVVGTGGFFIYNYIWSTIPTQNTSIITDLTEGTYSVTVTNGANCTAVETITLTDPQSNHVDFSSQINMNIGTFNNLSTGNGIYLWDFGDSTISYLNNPVHVFNNVGTYNVCLTQFSACDTIVHCDLIIITGEQESMLDNVPILTYPNPTHDELHVNVNYDNSVLVRIYDLSGRNVLTIPDLHKGDNEIQLKGLEKGIYLLNFITQDQKTIGTCKLIFE